MEESANATPDSLGRLPLACGALGSYDPERLRRLGEGMPARMTLQHSDPASALMLDRDPIEWHGHRRRGLAWSELARPRPDAPYPGDWTDLASGYAAAGLVIERPRRIVHTSVSGITPLYYAASDGAVYFASRIDPLVRVLPGALTADWAAWSSIFCLKYPLGIRTPFEEVRRMPPLSTLEWAGGKARLHREPWPWAEMKPVVGIDEGADAVVAALRAVLAPLRGADVVCPLTGGLDSRILLSALLEVAPHDLIAVTVAGHHDTDREEAVAAEVAGRLGVRHETRQGDAEAYWDEARERALRCDFQLATDPWLMPLVERLRGANAIVPDGLGLDVLAFIGRRFYSRPMARPDGGDWIASEIWDLFGGSNLRRMTPKLLSGPLGRTMRRRVRGAFLRQTERLRGCPTEPVLVHYVTRTLRGISLNPSSIVGTDAAAITPFCDDALVRACLSIEPEQKFGGHLYSAIFDRLAPEAGRIPPARATEGPAAPTTPRRLSPPALEGYLATLRSGPLLPFLGPRFHAALAAGDVSELLRRGGERRIVEAVVLYHLWCERYGSRVRGTDPVAALRIDPPSH